MVNFFRTRNARSKRKLAEYHHYASERRITRINTEKHGLKKDIKIFFVPVYPDYSISNQILRKMAMNLGYYTGAQLPIGIPARPDYEL